MTWHYICDLVEIFVEMKQRLRIDNIVTVLPCNMLRWCFKKDVKDRVKTCRDY